MRNRVKDLQELVKITGDLSDADLHKLASMARYMRDAQGETTKDPMLDLIIGTFRQIAESKGAVLYSVLFRKAGIGIQWWEEKRAGPEPIFPKVYRQEEAGDYLDLMQAYHKRGLVVYSYYPTLSETISREWSRLEEIK